MKKPGLVLSVALGFLLTESAAHATGSLVINASHGNSYGWAIDHPSQASADAYALGRCASNCAVVVHFTATCAAYAVDQSPNSTIQGWAIHHNLVRAETGAMSDCITRGGRSCTLLISGCDQTGDTSAAIQAR
jgi:hypothetical protein